MNVKLTPAESRLLSDILDDTPLTPNPVQAKASAGIYTYISYFFVHETISIKLHEAYPAVRGVQMPSAGKLRAALEGCVPCQADIDAAARAVDPAHQRRVAVQPPEAFMLRRPEGVSRALWVKAGLANLTNFALAGAPPVMARERKDVETSSEILRINLPAQLWKWIDAQQVRLKPWTPLVREWVMGKKPSALRVMRAKEFMAKRRSEVSPNFQGEPTTEFEARKIRVTPRTKNYIPLAASALGCREDEYILAVILTAIHDH